MGSGKPKVRVIKRRYPLELEGEPDAKGGRFYPPEDAPVPVKRQVTHGAPKLKKSLKPGSIVILLAGAFKGKRCIFLKQLESGLLLIAGPRSVNGVPLRRVNQAYVIGTSTGVDVSGIKLDKFTDAYFKPAGGDRKKKNEETFFEEEGKPAKKVEMTPEFIADNKDIDAKLEKAVAGMERDCETRIISVCQGGRVMCQDRLHTRAHAVVLRAVVKRERERERRERQQRVEEKELLT